MEAGWFELEGTSKDHEISCYKLAYERKNIDVRQVINSKIVTRLSEELRTFHEAQVLLPIIPEADSDRITAYDQIISDD